MARQRSALLINPPVYDTQYWANWSLPYGLLRVASWLRENGYILKLLDCMEANKTRTARKKARLVRRLCSLEEDKPARWQNYSPPADWKIEFCFGVPPEEIRDIVRGMKRRARETLFPEAVFPEPDEIWISSIMTYWWESTRDVIQICRETFPKAVFRVGGVYPTLIPEHAMTHLGLRNPLHLKGRDLDPHNPKQLQRDIVVSATIPDANPLPLALDLYRMDGVGDPEPGGKLPEYTILTTSRGCPFQCAYCAANILNEGRRVWVRKYDSVYEEIKHWFHDEGIREFCFYEDNLLLGEKNFLELLKLIAADRELRGIELHAPEGVEVRLLHPEVVDLMRRAGFKRIYFPLETVNAKMHEDWGRTHTNLDRFFYGFQNAVAAGYKARCQELNCFVLFGLPDEDLQAVYDTVIFASSRVGSVIPMLFTPVPGTPIFDRYREYTDDKGFDLHHLNGKLLPFLDYNRRQYPGLTHRDYSELEALMWRLNAKVRSESFDIGASSPVATAFRAAFLTIDM